jgi:TolB-like protein
VHQPVKNFFTELKRRNVYKVAVAYAIVGWLVMQIAATVVPALHLSDAITSTVVLLVILGFPMALIIAWAFELTPEGLKRTEVADELPKKSARSHAWIYMVVVAAAISISLFFFGRYTATSKKSGLTELPAKSIAVLPFENQNRDPNTDYLSDGIPESIINSLSQLPQLRVMARSTVFSYKGKDVDPRKVGNDLGVHAVLMVLRECEQKIAAEQRAVERTAHITEERRANVAARAFAVGARMINVADDIMERHPVSSARLLATGVQTVALVGGAASNYNVNNLPPPIVTIVKEWKGEGAPPPPVEELSLEELESLAASLQRVDSGKAGAISQA